jgi:hypothetical protein
MAASKHRPACIVRRREVQGRQGRSGRATACPIACATSAEPGRYNGRKTRRPSFAVCYSGLGGMFLRLGRRFLCDGRGSTAALRALSPTCHGFRLGNIIGFG